MFQVDVIVKSIVSVRDHLHVGQLSTTWLLWIVFSVVKVEERGLKAFKRHGTLTILKMDVYLQVRNFSSMIFQIHNQAEHFHRI